MGAESGGLYRFLLSLHPMLDMGLIVQEATFCILMPSPTSLLLLTSVFSNDLMDQTYIKAIIRL